MHSLTYKERVCEIKSVSQFAFNIIFLLIIFSAFKAFAYQFTCLKSMKRVILPSLSQMAVSKKNTF